MQLKSTCQPLLLKLDIPIENFDLSTNTVLCCHHCECRKKNANGGWLVGKEVTNSLVVPRKKFVQAPLLAFSAQLGSAWERC